MLSFLIILALLYAFYAGARRGLVLQVMMTVGYLVSFIVARLFYKQFGRLLELFIPYPSATENSKLNFFDSALTLKLDQAFYAAVAFIIILFIGWLLVRFISLFLVRFTYYPVVRKVNFLAGGILGFLVVYIGIFLILYTMALIPTPSIQNTLNHSWVAHLMIQYSPILSSVMYNWWITKII